MNRLYNLSGYVAVAALSSAATYICLVTLTPNLPIHTIQDDLEDQGASTSYTSPPSPTADSSQAAGLEDSSVNVASDIEIQEPVSMSNSDESTVAPGSEGLMVLEQRFTQEIYDAGWVNPIQSSLIRLFDTDPALNGSELIEATCQSTMCRVEIRHKNNSAQEQLVPQLSKAYTLASRVGDIAMHQVPANKSEDGLSRTIFFAARLGHSLPN